MDKSEKVGIWIKDLNLNNNDLKRIRQGEWLNTAHIDAVRS